MTSDGVVACTQTTDARGRFHITRAAFPSGTLWAKAPGFAPGFASVGDASTTIRLFAQRAVHGSVLRGLSGEPVVGAGLALRLLRKNRYFHPKEIASCPFPLEATSGADGRFVFSGLYPVEEYDLVISATGLAAEIMPLPPESSEPLRIALRPEGTVEGCALDLRTGVAIAGAMIEVDRPRWGISRIVTDASGRFGISELGNERLVLRAWSERQFLAGKVRQGIYTKAGRVSAATLFVEPGYLPTLALRDAKTGRPIRGGRATLDTAYDIIPRAVVLESATKALPLLPRLPVGCVVSASGYLPESTLLLPPGDATDARIVPLALTPAPRLHVQVRDQHGAAIPLADVTAEARPRGRWEVCATSVTSSTGYAQLAIAVENQPGVRLTVMRAGYSPYQGFAPARRRDTSHEAVLLPMGVVSGRVRMAGGSPVPLATVTVSLSPREITWSTTVPVEPDGTWRLSQAPAGRLSLVADASGFVSQKAVELRLEPGGAAEAPELVLQKRLSISGCVVDADSKQPIPGCTLTCRQDWFKISPAVSGADGAFRLTGFPPGTVYLKATPPDTPGSPYRGMDTQMDLAEEDVAGVTVELAQRVSIEGTVLDADSGTPLEGVLLRVGNKAPLPGRNYPGDDVQTDERGRFRALVPRGWKHIGFEVWRGGFFPAYQDVLTAGAPARDIVIRLRRTASVTGVVLDASGEPAPGAWVWGKLREAPPGGYPAARCTADQDGRFTLDGLHRADSRVSPGAWTLLATRNQDPKAFDKPNASASTVDIDVASGEELAGIILRVPVRVKAPTGALAGEVRDGKGNPCPGAGIILSLKIGPTEAEQGLDPWELQQNPPVKRDARSVADSEGRFRFDDLPLVDCGVAVFTAEGQVQEFPTARVPNENLILRMPPTTRLSGRVVDDRTGEPVKQYSLWPDSPDGSKLGAFTDPSRMIGPDGTFSMVLHGTGTCVLHARLEDGQYGETAPFAVAQGDVRENIEIRLTAGTPIKVVAHDRRGTAVEGAKCRIAFTPWDGMYYAREITTDGDGTALFPYQRAGAYDISVAYQDFPEHKEQIRVEGSDVHVVEVTVPEGGAIEGTVTDGAGHGVAGVAVGVENKAVETDAAGCYRLQRLPAGNFHLGVRWLPKAVGAAPLELHREVVVAEGETVTANFNAPAGRVKGRVTCAGRAVGGADVHLDYVSKSDAPPAVVKTDALGRYQFEEVAAGRIALAVRLAGADTDGALVREEFDIEVAGAAVVDLALPSGRIRGQVDVPQGSGHVLLDLSGPQGRHMSVDPAAPPEFLMQYLPAGRYELRASCGRLNAATMVELEEGQELRNVRVALLTWGRVSGHVHGLTPGDDAKVYATGPGAYGQGVKADGEYELRYVIPGERHFIVYADGLVREEQTVAIEEDSDTRLDWHLRTPVTVRLTLAGLDSTGLPEGKLPFNTTIACRGAYSQRVRWRATDRPDTFEAQLGHVNNEVTLSVHNQGTYEFRLDLTDQAPGAVVEETVDMRSR